MANQKSMMANQQFMMANHKSYSNHNQHKNILILKQISIT